MKNLSKNIILWIVVGLLLVALFNLFQNSSSNKVSANISFSDFMAAANSGNVSEVNIRGNNIDGYFDDGRSFTTYSPNYPDLVNNLNSQGVKITAEPTNKSMHPILSVLLSWFPMLLLIGVWIFFMRQMQGGGGKAMGFGKSKAKLLNEAVGKITFNDVAGIDEAKQELEEVVEFLKDPKKFSRLGGKIPTGALLVGPPGTGKTLLARAIAGEANVPFFSISGSDFVEMFVGVGASRVRDMFDQGKKNSPCIIFIDEIDAVGRHRGAGLGGGNDEREQTLNQLLVEMDGFEANAGVIIIAATNRPDVLDPALLRPGRFDRQITVSNPDIIGRDKILKVHIKKIKVSPKFDSKIIARGTPGFSGADLANLVNEAALLASRKNKRMVTLEDFESAKDKVMMGAERRSMVMSEDEKKLTAYHEAGHAVATIHSPASDPIHKATIIPRGRALGMVMRLPERDQLSMKKDEMKAHLLIAAGGRIAEEMIFGIDKITNGAASDIQMVTNLAKKMVTEWGMSEKLGRLRYNNDTEEVFLGHSVAQSKNNSDATAKIIDDEIRFLAEEAENNCKKILQENVEQLHIIAKGLLEYETLSGEEINDLVKGIKPSRDDFDNDVNPEPTIKPSVPKAGNTTSPQTN
jgi:cell division protease FtsH